ncbi:MAG: hypothetical protein UCJ13_03595 [Bacteroidaceae bacterium]|nr:hypothetical protein [Bacteroidaceae bacterium]MEE0689899.1 hypothetical protein [Bacteroidaceae bacterium]
MTKTIIATLKGVLDSSIAILLDTAHKVGEVLDISNITKLVPTDTDYTAFFRNYVNFCTSNGSKQFRIESINQTREGFEIMVSPV